MGIEDFTGNLDSVAILIVVYGIYHRLYMYPYLLLPLRSRYVGSACHPQSSLAQPVCGLPEGHLRDQWELHHTFKVTDTPAACP